MNNLSTHTEASSSLRLDFCVNYASSSGASSILFGEVELEVAGVLFTNFPATPLEVSPDIAFTEQVGGSARIAFLLSELHDLELTDGEFGCLEAAHRALFVEPDSLGTLTPDLIRQIAPLVVRRYSQQFALLSVIG